MRGGWALVSLLGCTDHVFVPYPDPSALTELLLLGNDGKQEPDRIEVIDRLAAAPLLIDLSKYDHVEAWTFDETAGELGVAGGYQHIGTAVGRERYDLNQWVEGAWRPQDTSAWASFVLLPHPVDCIDSGGCSGGGGVCSIPCPEQPLPQEPARIALADPSCPDSWRAEGGACEPWKFDPTSCTGMTAALPGAESCVPIGTPCAGKWPAEVGLTVYVEAGAAGVGTSDDPVGTIAEALAIHAGRIALSGTFSESPVIEGPVDIVGCPGTVIQGEVQVRGEVALDTLTISALVVDVGATRDGQWCRHRRGRLRPLCISTGNTSMRDVVLRSRSTALLVSAFGRVEGFRIELRGRDGAYVEGWLALEEASVMPAIGVVADHAIAVDGGVLNLDQTVIEGWPGAALVLRSCFAQLRRIMARRTAGLQATSSTVNLSDSRFMDTAGRHLLLQSSTTTVARSILSGSTGAEGLGQGEGVVAFAGSVGLQQTVIRDAAADAIALQGVRLSLVDVAIADVLGKGISGTSAVLTALRVEISGVSDRAIDMHGESGAITDVVIRDVGLSRCDICSGVCARESSSLVLSRVRIEGASGAAVGSFGINSSVAGSDVAVQDTVAPGECIVAATSAGVTAQDGAVIQLSRFVVEDNERAGVSVYSVLGARSPSLVLTEGTIRGNPIGLLLLIEDFDLSGVRSVLLDNPENVRR